MVKRAIRRAQSNRDISPQTRRVCSSLLYRKPLAVSARMASGVLIQSPYGKDHHQAAVMRRKITALSCSVFILRCMKTPRRPISETNRRCAVSYSTTGWRGVVVTRVNHIIIIALFVTRV